MCRPSIKNFNEHLLSNREIRSSPDGRFQDCWWWTKGCFVRGYGSINYCKRSVYVHRLAAHLWLDFDINSDLKVCHKCDNPKCFNPDHLFIGTQRDNFNDMCNKKRRNIVFGSNHGNTLLTEENILEIRKLWKEEKLCQRKIAKKFYISQSTTCAIINRKTWSHL